MKVRSTLAWSLSVLVGALYVVIGFAKFAAVGASMFADWGLPAWLAPVIGIVEVAAGIGLMVPSTTRWSVYALSVAMVGAFCTHLANAEYLDLLRPIIFSAVFWLAFYLRSAPRRQRDEDAVSPADALSVPGERRR